MQLGNLLLSSLLKRWRFLLAFVFGVLLPLFFFLLFNVLEADTGSVELTGNGSIQSSQDTCGAGGAYDCLDDGVTIPGAVSAGGDFMTLANTKADFYLLDTIGNVATVTQVVLNYYHGEGGASAYATLGLFAANEATQYGTTQNIPNRSLAQWDTATITNLSLTQTQLDDLRVKLDCEKTGGGSSYTCNGYALYADITYVPRTNVRVNSVGSQQNIDVGSTTAYVGGAFSITEVQNCTSCAVDSITIRESGSVNAQTNLDNIRLYYELDTNTPFDCAAETFSGTETQFGVTDTDGFSGADGTATFTGNVSISTASTMCVYVVFDVGSGASPGETVEISVLDPSTEVSTVLNQIVRPTTTIAIAGTTKLQAVNLDQTNFHWRDDTGNENDPGGSASLTGGSENVNYDTLSIGTPVRLRMEVANLGNKSSAGEQYRLEYGKKVSTCENVHIDSSWVDVGAGGGDFDMYDSMNLTHGNDTTDIAVSIGGVTNATSTFLSSNGGILDTSSQSGTITLAAGELVELEYSIQATSNAVEGNKYCFRVTDASTEIDNYTRYPEATILADVNVDTEGAQPTYLNIPQNNVVLGGFNFFGQTPGEKTIASTTITATGTIDFANDIEEIRLMYDLDVTNPYNCGDESFDGDELQYGSTDVDGFTPVSGTSTFTGTAVASTTQAVCMYVVLNIATSTTDNTTLEVRINNPTEDVGTDSGTVSPAALLDLDGLSTAVKPILTINHYHWRDDTGSEANAPSATGAEDTGIPLWKVGVPKRLRFDVSNEGSTTTDPYQFRLEYATKVSICSEATGWVDVGSTPDLFDMYDSSNLTDGDDTTNIATSTGGVTNTASSFLSNNNGVKDTSSQTAAITLLGDQFTELEFSVVASSTTVEGKTYCFRLTDAGSQITGLNIYAEATIKPPTDFYIQRGVSVVTGTSLTVSAGPDYIAPSSSSTAFVRITNTQLTGAGDSGAPANSNSDDVTVYISNAANLATSFDLVRTGNSGDTRVDWEIVEFTGAPGSNNEIIVREQSFVTLGTATTGASTASISNIQDDSDVVVFITGQGNRATDRTNYNAGLATASWGATGDTAHFLRGTIGGGTALDVSYAVVEFVGSNWNIQRVEHTYSAVGTTETASTTAVGSLARVFLHAQKRVGSGLNTHANIGHEVWMSGLGQVSFLLDSGATTPSGHISVAWLVENTQFNGTPMVVTRSNGPQSGGSEPGTFNVAIGKTLNDIDIASIFINNRSSGAVTTFPQPMMAVRLLNNGTQYELWVSKTTNIRNYRTEVVEWPTGDRQITQNYYRFYVDNDALDPTDPWPSGIDDVGDNTPVTIYNDPIAIGEAVRLRMTLVIAAAKMNAGVDTFKLQYGEMAGTCGGIDEADWHDLGDSSSTTALWRGHNGTEVDGTALSTDPPNPGDLNITAVADVAGTYEEENPTAAVPFQVDPGEDVEYDWSIENYAAKEKTDYCFRMTESDGTLLEDYIRHPTMRTAGYTPVLNNWRFFDDEQSITPTIPLAATNTAPTDIAFENIIKLRTTVEETTGGDGLDNKFKLQYSEYSDFSKEVFDVVATSTCTASSTWCYADGAGTDNAVVDGKTLADADACSGGVGDGCGTHNESAASTTATYDQPALSMAEYEFTMVHSGARANAVYYFRLYDVSNATTVPASTTNPSLVTEGASLLFTVNGLASGTTTEGVVTDATTTYNAITFGEVPIGDEYEAAHRITIDTNATEGYQVFAFSRGDFQSSSGAEIPNVTGTNVAPQGWSIGCSNTATGCFGYHTGDDLLAGGSTRFAPTDSYAAFSSTTPEEILYSSVPTAESHNIIYKVQVGSDQPAGQYETDVVYLAVPVF